MLILKNETIENIWTQIHKIQGNAKQRIVCIEDVLDMANSLKEFPEKSLVMELRMNISPRGGWSYVGSWLRLERVGESLFEAHFARDTTRASKYRFNVISFDPKIVKINFKHGRVGINSLEDIKLV